MDKLGETTVKEIHDNIPLTKGHLKEFKSLIKSKEYFMLSELIDNSLSSYIRHTNDFKNEGVEYDKKGFIKKIDDFIIEINYKKGLESRDNTITIIDNAYGIRPENIKEVLTPGGGQSSKDSKLNVYGMGLKQAAWWSGEKLKILTKREELNFRYFTEIDLDDGVSSEEVIFDAIPNGERINFVYDKDEFYLHGTRIEISKLNANKYQKLADQIIFLSKDQNNINMYHTANEMVIPAISLKYKRWVERGMKIIFSYADDNDEKNNDWLIIDKNSFNIPIEEPIKTLKSHVAEIYREDNDYRNKYESETYFFAVASQEILDDIKNDYGIDAEAYKLTKDILLNYDKNENFEMKEKIPLDIPGLEKPVFVEFKYISSLQKKDRFFSRYRGLYIYDFDRAIHTGPNEKNVRNEQGFGTYDIYSEPDVTRDTELNLRSLFGEMDIDYLIAEEIIRLDSNKRGIITNEGATKDFSAAILESAKKFTIKYGPLITKINKWFKQTKEEKQKSSDSEESGIITNIATSQTNIVNSYVWDSFEKKIIETKSFEEVKEIIKKDSTKQQLSALTLKLNSKSEKIFFSITEEEGEKYSYPYQYELDYDQEEQREVYNIKLNVRSILFIPSLNGIDSDNRKKAQKSIKATFYKMSWIDILSDIIINKHLNYKDNVDKFSFVNDDFFSLIYEEFSGNLISIKDFLVRQVFGGD